MMEYLHAGTLSCFAAGTNEESGFLKPGVKVLNELMEAAPGVSGTLLLH